MNKPKLGAERAHCLSIGAPAQGPLTLACPVPGIADKKHISRTA